MPCLQRAEILNRSGKYDRAEENLNRVLRLQADSPEVHYGLAKLHQGRGQNRIYREELAQGAAINPTLLPVRIEAVQDLLGSGDAKAGSGNPRARHPAA